VFACLTAPPSVVCVSFSISTVEFAPTVATVPKYGWM
jgi:hypothetical protein